MMLKHSSGWLTIISSIIVSVLPGEMFFQSYERLQAEVFQQFTILFTLKLQQN